MIKNTKEDKVYTGRGIYDFRSSATLEVGGRSGNHIRLFIVEKEDVFHSTERATIYLNEKEALHLYHYLGWLLGK